MYTAVGPCVLPLAQPLEVVEVQTEEGSSEEGVIEGQHPRVHCPHHGQLQAVGDDLVKLNMPF